MSVIIVYMSDSENWLYSIPRNSTVSKLIKYNKGRGTQVIFHKDQRCISVILEVNIVQLSSDIITLTLLVSTEVN